MPSVKTVVAAFAVGGAVGAVACSIGKGRPAVSGVLSVVSLLVAVVALVFAYQALETTRRSHTMTGWEAANALGLQHYQVLGPLTPYLDSSESEAVIRTFLLYRLNRFFTETDPRLNEGHIRFRQHTMGNSLGDFRNKILGNGGTPKIADLAVKVLREVHVREPYYDEAFWETYFHGWRWE
jgi:hypothetical protein